MINNSDAEIIGILETVVSLLGAENDKNFMQHYEGVEEKDSFLLLHGDIADKVYQFIKQNIKNE